MNEVHHKTHHSHPVHFFFLSLFLLGALIGFSFLFQNLRSPSSRAYRNTATIKIKLQGDFLPQVRITGDVTLYKSQGKVKEFKNIIFSAQPDKTFEGEIAFDGAFDYSALYALYIKPKKYFGKLFCQSQISGSACVTPQIRMDRNGTYLYLTSSPFAGGDIEPINGRVDAEDISRIVSNLGKSTDLSTDINSDGVTNTADYSLAFYSINNNIENDSYTLEVPWAPSITLTPPIPTPTYPFPTRHPTYSYTYSPSSFQGVCEALPAPFSVRLCNLQKERINSTSQYGTCNNIYASTNSCSAVYLKKRCSCPTGYVCQCQLKDQSSQTVECTYGGRLEVQTCNVR